MNNRVVLFSLFVLCLLQAWVAPAAAGNTCIYSCVSPTAPPTIISVSTCSDGCTKTALCPDSTSFSSVCTSESLPSGTVTGSLQSQYSYNASHCPSTLTVKDVKLPYINASTLCGYSCCNETFYLNTGTSRTFSFSNYSFVFTGLAGNVPLSCVEPEGPTPSFYLSASAVPTFFVPEAVFGVAFFSSFNNQPIFSQQLVYGISSNETVCVYSISSSSGGGSSNCFPPDAGIATSVDGTQSVPLSAIDVGDAVVGVRDDGKLVPDTVIGWMHREPDAVAEFIELQLDDARTLRATGEHLVYAATGADGAFSAYRAVYAKHVAVGQHLYDARRQTAARVVHKHISTRRGLYAPLTRTGRMMVDGVVVSCYGSFPSHTVAHWSLAPARVTVMRRLFRGAFGPSGSHGIMGYAKALYHVWQALPWMTASHA